MVYWLWGGCTPIPTSHWFFGPRGGTRFSVDCRIEERILSVNHIVYLFEKQRSVSSLNKYTDDRVEIHFLLQIWNWGKDLRLLIMWNTYSIWRLSEKLEIQCSLQQFNIAPLNKYTLWFMLENLSPFSYLDVVMNPTLSLVDLHLENVSEPLPNL